MYEYEEDIEQYARDLEDFIATHELPAQWFKVPDHVAIKCADALAYEYAIQELLPDARQGSQVSMDGRRLAALNLIVPQSVGSLGEVEWLEVMEPRPEKVGHDIVGLEHMEFYYPDFEDLIATLEQQTVDFKKESNPGHKWISIIINGAGQELKLNNRLLAMVVEEELEQGKAVPFQL